MSENYQVSGLTEIIKNSEKIVAFTGAGLSAESGIPTYRGAGGVWTKYDPSKYASWDYFRENPSYYWQFFKEVRYPTLKPAKPNAAHYALVELEKQGKLFQIITQNIDGLHQLAGQSSVCELHGNTRKIICLACAQKFTMENIFGRLEKELPPRCSCGGMLKPDVVLFGESLPQEALRTSWQAAKVCDTLLVIGSSLVVYPAAQIPLFAKENGARLVIINIDPTPYDDLADLVINKSAVEVLSQVVPVKSKKS
jgi:NAD-dependent deacetylase